MDNILIMPFRARRVKKSVGRRAGFRRRFPKKVSPVKSMMTGIHSIKLRSISQVYAGGTGLINYYVNDASVASFNDWTPMGNLYDLYRVMSCTLKYIPTGNVTSTIALTGGGSSSTGNTPMYVFYDADNTSRPSTVVTDVNCLEYENCKVFSMNKPWTYHHKFDKINSLSSAAVTSKAGGWLDVAAAGTNASQVICVFKDVVTGYVLQGGQQCGTVIVTMEVQFKDKR